MFLSNKVSLFLYYFLKQEPTLFVGTVRSNLDPFKQRSDIELWNALEHVNLEIYIICKNVLFYPTTKKNKGSAKRNN